MNYARRLFDYFNEDKSRNHIVLAPNAPPIEQAPNGINVALEAVLDDNDITDTLLGLQTYSGENNALTPCNADVPAMLSDTFCLSIRGTGRFRVSYLTQRGSKAITISRIPFAIPSCNELNLDIPTTERLLRVFRNHKGGIVAVFGPSPEANSKVVYSLLREINSKDRSVILVLERELTHLLRHDNSIVVQRELGSDCTSIEEGIREGLNFAPQIIFVGDLLLTDRLPSLVRAVETQASVILSVVAHEKTSFLHVLKAIFREQYPILARRTREILKVTPLPDGELTAAFAAQTTTDSTA